MSEKTNQHDEFVYHGSPIPFDRAVPKQNVRTTGDSPETERVIFDEVSFHAAQLRAVALTYTHDDVPIMKDDENSPYYGMGVDLYNNPLEVQILGTGSLEDSLRYLYGKGGYILKFNKRDFFHMQGLGNHEMISMKELKPVSMEYVEDPVAEMLQAGVKFHFIDVMKSKQK